MAAKASINPVAARYRLASRMLAAVGTMLTLGILGFAFHLVQKDRTAAIALWTESARAQSIALAGYVRQTLLASDLVLRSVSDRVQAEGAASVSELRALLGTREVHEMLKNRQSSVPQVSVASIVDRDGDMVNFTRNYPPRSNSGASINLSERDYFKAHLHDPALDLYLSVPVENKGTGTWTFYLARKIRARESGDMLGVVLAGLESQHFQELFAQIASDGRMLALVHHGGALIARWPRDIGTLGAPEQTSALDDSGPDLDPASAVQTASELIAALFDQGGPRTKAAISVSTRVEGYPAFVNVGVTAPMVAATWIDNAGKTLVMALIAALTTLCLTALLLRLLGNNYRMVEALDAARKTAERATQAKAMFVATMSHEVRTPMNAIVGLVEALGRTELDAKQQALLDVVADSSDALLELVNEVLDFSHLEATESALKEGTFSVHKLVEQVTGVARACPYGRELQLRHAIGAEVPIFLHGDKGRISRILLNLLSNALKYTDSGLVTLQVRLHDVRGNKAVIDFSVIDTGCGVGEDMRERIFEPYQQGRNGPRGPSGQGSGLGLSISRRVAEMLGGTLALEASGPRGSTFTLRVPLRIGAAAPAVDAIGAIGNSLTKGLAVLVAEDTASSQLVLKLILETLGAQVLVVNDGAQAVEAAANGDFDVVFLDVQMPVMGGLEAAQTISLNFARTAAKPPLIIGVSAYAEESDRQRALESGMDEYLTKPVRAKDVSDLLLKRVMPRAARATSLATTPAAAGLDTVDRKSLEELLDALGSENFSEALLRFRQDADEAIEKTLTLVATRDAAGVRVMAHRLKGLFEQFGAQAAAAEAARVQKAPAETVLATAAFLAAAARQAVTAVNSAALAVLADPTAAEAAP